LRDIKDASLLPTLFSEEFGVNVLRVLTTSMVPVTQENLEDVLMTESSLIAAARPRKNKRSAVGPVAAAAAVSGPASVADGSSTGAGSSTATFLPEVVSCGVVVLRRNPEGVLELLALRRIRKKEMYDMPKGRMEDSDKTKPDCAFRELEEEAGLGEKDVHRISRFCHTTTYSVPASHYPFDTAKTVHLYLAAVTNPDTLVKVSSEHAGFKWFPLFGRTQIPGAGIKEIVSAVRTFATQHVTYLTRLLGEVQIPGVVAPEEKKAAGKETAKDGAPNVATAATTTARTSTSAESKSTQKQRKGNEKGSEKTTKVSDKENQEGQKRQARNNGNKKQKGAALESKEKQEEEEVKISDHNTQGKKKATRADEEEMKESQVTASGERKERSRSGKDTRSKEGRTRNTTSKPKGSQQSGSITAPTSTSKASVKHTNTSNTTTTSNTELKKHSADELCDLYVEGVAFLMKSMGASSPDTKQKLVVEATKLFETGAQHGHLPSIFYLTRLNQPSNGEDALQVLMSLAKRGYAPAMYWLGTCHSYGIHAELDTAMGQGWFRKAWQHLSLPTAPKHGQAPGEDLFWRAEILMNGHGQAKNMKEAVRLYRDAADLGFPEAGYWLSEVQRVYPHLVTKDSAEEKAHQTASSKQTSISDNKDSKSKPKNGGSKSKNKGRRGKKTDSSAAASK